jgi:protein-S-isoprenylcysteine O-methyltransferase Ste14
MVALCRQSTYIERGFMASALNKHRIRDTRLGLIVSVLVLLFTRPVIDTDSALYALSQMAGNILVTLCIVGRVAATTFLGGHKNTTLITYGLFSVCRNPLYFFSFLGACGIALMSAHLVLIVLMPALFLWVYLGVIAREEVFLGEQFGEEYRQYCETTPRFFPRFSLYHAPETIPMVPQFLVNALRDAAGWLVAFPVMTLIARLHESGVLPTIASIY